MYRWLGNHNCISTLSFSFENIMVNPQFDDSRRKKCMWLVTYNIMSHVIVVTFNAVYMMEIQFYVSGTFGLGRKSKDMAFQMWQICQKFLGVQTHMRAVFKSTKFRLHLRACVQKFKGHIAYLRAVFKSTKSCRIWEQCSKVQRSC